LDFSFLFSFSIALSTCKINSICHNFSHSLSLSLTLYLALFFSIYLTLCVCGMFLCCKILKLILVAYAAVSSSSYQSATIYELMGKSYCPASPPPLWQQPQQIHSLYPRDLPQSSPHFVAAQKAGQMYKLYCQGLPTAAAKTTN